MQTRLYNKCVYSALLEQTDIVKTKTEHLIQLSEQIQDTTNVIESFGKTSMCRKNSSKKSHLTSIYLNLQIKEKTLM